MLVLPFSATQLSDLCDELDRWRERLDHRGPLPRTWAGRLRRELEAESIAASTSMEGVPVTVDEVRRILAGAPAPEVSAENRGLVEGYRDGMSFVLRRADDPAFRWSRELLVAVHDRVLGGRHSEGAGRLRADRPAYLVDTSTGNAIFLPPAGADVLALVDEACRLMEEHPRHPALASAWIHVAVAAIHPFRDGNGRAARVFASLAMYRGGFKRPEFTSLEEWWGRHRADYYGAFACLGNGFDPRVDVTPFVRAHLEAQLHQVRALDVREQVEGRIWTAVEQIAEDRGLHPRVANALWDAFFGRDVTAGYFRPLADVSPATATKDLAAAVAAQLLRAEGRRRGRRYLAAERLYAEAGRVLLMDVTGPPDTARAEIVAEIGRRVAERAVPE